MRSLALAALLALAGCAGAYRDGGLPTTPHFGQAVRTNIAVQVAAAAANGDAATDGARGALAVRKYQANAGQTLAPPSVTSVGSTAGAE